MAAACCNSKLNLRQKRLRSASPPRPVDARAERRVDDEVHVARFVEEALEDHLPLRRQRAEGRMRGGEIFLKSAALAVHTVTPCC